MAAKRVKVPHSLRLLAVDVVDGLNKPEEERLVLGGEYGNANLRDDDGYDVWWHTKADLRWDFVLTIAQAKAISQGELTELEVKETKLAEPVPWWGLNGLDDDDLDDDDLDDEEDEDLPDPASIRAAVQLIRHLVDHDKLELAEGGELQIVAIGFAAVLNTKPNVGQLADWIIEHPMVEELYMDDNELSVLLRSW